MTGRYKLLSALGGASIAAALWGAGASSAANYGPAYGPPCAAGPCSPAAPCSPDGACWPKHDTWGWYPTRWRAFPGDVVGLAPTEAEETRPEAPEDILGGPQPPEAARESQTAPERPERGRAPANGQAPAVEAPAGLEPPPAEGGAPPADDAPEAQPMPDLPLGPEDPLGSEDPLSGAPPTPPWLVEQEGPIRLEQPGSVAVADGSELEQASTFTPMPPAPNIHQDDAPPALPPSLMPALGSEPVAMAPVTQASPALPKPMASPSLVQPSSVRPAASSAPAVDRRIVPASAQLPRGVDPQGIAVINPAAAIQAVSPSDGPQQAIYFEASDWVSDQE